MVSVGAQARFEAAQALVLRAGEALRAGRLDAVGVRRKTDHQDLVTVFDQSTEQLLRRGILEAFPQDAVVGEEYPASGAPGRQGAVWYLDPIDGTTNFVNQRRGYAVSAACWQGGAPLFGIVLDVAARELYTAQAGGGAWCNGRPLHTSPRSEVCSALLYTPGVLHTFLKPHPWREGLCRLASEVRAVRSLGSVALELCAVAAGRAELFAATRSSPWDHNAARVILAEAGGCICRMDGAPLAETDSTAVLAACSPGLLAAMRARLGA